MRNFMLVTTQTHGQTGNLVCHKISGFPDPYDMPLPAPRGVQAVENQRTPITSIVFTIMNTEPNFINSETTQNGRSKINFPC